MTLDPDRPRRLLEEVLARREFGERGSPASDLLGPWLRRLADALERAPGWLDEAVLVAVVGGALVLAVLVLTDRGGRVRRAGARGDGPGDFRDAATPARRPARQLLAAGLAARAEGRWTEAVELLFRATVAGLVEHGLLLDDPSRTNREHVRDLRPRAEAARALADAVSPFERVRYGRRDASESDAERIAVAAASLVPDLWRAAGAGPVGPASATREGAA